MAQTQDLTCVHRWILSEPSKGSISGTCRRCGARKVYSSGIQPLQPPPEDSEDEEEEVEVLEGAALAESIKSMKREVLV